MKYTVIGIRLKGVSLKYETVQHYIPSFGAFIPDSFDTEVSQCMEQTL